MKATINDVAKHAGVSIKTVSRVINNEPSVRQLTREKVQAAVDELSGMHSLKFAKAPVSAAPEKKVAKAKQPPEDTQLSMF